jgi:hypothetical protein
MILTVPIQIWYDNTEEDWKNNWYTFNVMHKPIVRESYYF